MSHMLDQDTIKRNLHLHQVQGLEARVIAERFGFSSSRVHNVIRRQAASSKHQAASFKHQAASFKRLEKDIIK